MSPDPSGLSVDRPFGPIGLAISGGGGRAAGFHMGTLAYLDRLNLLKDVTVLSSVSGGSFVAASYALTLKRAPAGETLHASFRRFYDEFYTYLLNARLLPWALERLADGSVKVPSGRRTLVTALAQVYDDTFLHHASFGEFWEGPPIHLDDLILNATEFKTGLAFRFHYNRQAARCGSAHVSFDAALARKFRLADVVASSACIPIGLEPIVCPDDFRPPDDDTSAWQPIRDELRASCGVDAVPIMDGGVYDNQGMEAVLETVRGADTTDLKLGRSSVESARRIGQRIQEMMPRYDRLGLFVISDAPLTSDNLYGVSATARPSGDATLGRVDLFTRALMVVAILTMVTIVVHALFGRTGARPLARDFDDLFLYTVPFVLAAILLMGVIWVRRVIRGVISQLPQIGDAAWAYLKRLTVHDCEQMVALRLSSAWVLTGSVYFNRIRHLGYSLIHSRPEFHHRIITQEIFDLITHEEGVELPDWLLPSPAMLEVANRAATLPTMLWFDSPQQMNDVVACGQMTMCWNLLWHSEHHHLTEESETLPADVAAARRRLVAAARADWEQLKADPFALVKDPQRVFPPAAAVA